jgi:hypothetical protein
MDDIVCTGCGAEPGDELGNAEGNLNYALLLNGWELEGEFGERCPECVAEARASGAEGTAGLDDLAEALGAKKKDEEAKS